MYFEYPGSLDYCDIHLDSLAPICPYPSFGLGTRCAKAAVMFPAAKNPTLAASIKIQMRSLARSLGFGGRRYEIFVSTLPIQRTNAVFYKYQLRLQAPISIANIS